CRRIAVLLVRHAGESAREFVHRQSTAFRGSRKNLRVKAGARIRFRPVMKSRCAAGPGQAVRRFQDRPLKSQRSQKYWDERPKWGVVNFVTFVLKRTDEEGESTE